MSPAKSKKQKEAACMALAAKKGEMPVEELRGTAKEMYQDMSQSKLADYCRSEIKNE